MFGVVPFALSQFTMELPCVLRHARHPNVVMTCQSHALYTSCTLNLFVFQHVYGLAPQICICASGPVCQHHVLYDPLPVDGGEVLLVRFPLRAMQLSDICNPIGFDVQLLTCLKLRMCHAQVLAVRLPDAAVLHVLR